jgi:hypothetical protein
MMAKKKLDEAVLDCYVRLYKSSVPSVDFNYLVKNAKINEQGEKEIPFEDYIIDFDVSMEIINEIIKEYKIDKDYEHPFKVTIYQGCSPKYNKKY